MKEMIYKYFNLLLYTIFLLSCTSKNKYVEKDCNKIFNKYYYTYDYEDKDPSPHNFLFLYTSIKFGKTIDDSTYILIPISDGNTKDNSCLKFDLYFEGSEHFKFLRIEDSNLVFGSSKVNNNICNNEQLILTRQDVCENELEEFEFIRKKGVQEYPTLH